MRKEYYRQILQTVSGVLPTSYQYSNLSWETVIGAEVETLSVKKYGLNNFVADVLWKMATPGLVKEDAQHARIILRYTEKEKLAENVKNVCSRILDMKEIGTVQKREIPTSKCSVGREMNCRSNLTAAVGGEKSVSPADTILSTVGIRPTCQTP